MVATPPQELNVTLAPGVNVVIPAGAGSMNAVNLANSTNPSQFGASATLTANDANINNTNNPNTSNNTGLRIQSAGSATITASGRIAVAGTASNHAILAITEGNNPTSAPADVTVTYGASGAPGLGLSSGGTESTGIQADNRGNGDATINAWGDVTGIVGVGNTSFYGLIAHAGDPQATGAAGVGDASVHYGSGTIDVRGTRPRGIVVWAGGDGSASVITDPGTTIIVSGTDPANSSPTRPVSAGISLQLDSATAANGRALTATVASTIMNFGPAAPDTNIFRNPVGIRTISYADAPTTVTYSGPGITTQGGGGSGIMALSGSGSITVNASGPIDTTNGSNAVGILADNSGTVLGRSIGLLTDADTLVGGLPAAPTTGAVEVNVSNNVFARGEFGTGISATGGGDVRVNVAQGGLVMGGWQAGANSVGSTYGLPAAGVVLGSTGGTATLTNSGIVGALSDRAVASVDLYQPGFAGDVNIVNNGTITGYVTLGAGNDTFRNLTPNSFDIRNFADTNGDGIRDTKGVAISDFGAGNDQFLNEANGVVRLLPVNGAATTDATGYYVPTTGPDSRPLEASFYDLNREGIVQGQLVNLETFTNAGTIDLRNAAVGNAAPVVGNTLVITGNAAAGGAPGTGLYVSNGGRLLVNTVLNGGIPIGGQTNSYSDMLIVDGTRLGAGGATTIAVTNVGGNGALTPGNGIELVEVRNKAASDPGAFALAGDYVTKQGQQAVVGGAYAYTLQYGGVAGDGVDGNWYLRSQLVPTPGPTPGPFPPSPPVPLFQAGVPLYEVYPQNLLALVGMPTMQQRVGNRYWQQPAVATEVFCKDPDQNFKCRVSEEQARYYGLGGQSIIEGNGVWTRIEGSHINIDPAETTSGTDYDTDLWKLQAGFDGLLHEAEDGSRLIGGITVHYGQANSDVTSIYGDGSIDTDGYGFGGTLTWLGQNGFYVDGQASLTWFNSDLSSDTAHRSLADGNDGFGYALSVETGKKIDMSGNWTVTPQVQLVYANVDFDSFTDPFGADVSLGTGDSLRGRLGISADREQNWQDETGKTKRSHVYGIANLYYEFLDGSEVDVSGTKFETRPEKLWGGIGAGGSYNWNDDKYSIYGEVSANTSLESFGDSYAFNGTAGFRVKW